MSSFLIRGIGYSWLFLALLSVEAEELRVGLIGLDTSHVPAFTKLLNAENPIEGLSGCRVMAAYPKGSPDIESSLSRVPKYTEEVQAMGVEIVDSIDALLERVDVVLLETNDGRPHVEQAMPVLRAGKRLFIDKPMAASLAEVMLLFDAAEHFGTPLFSSSALRYGSGTRAVAKGSIGEVLAADVYGPCYLEKTHADFLWYGIHSVEALVTLMGTGCESVSRTQTEGQELIVGTWPAGRIGTVRGMRVGPYRFGGVAHGTKGFLPVGEHSGNEALLVEIARFLHGGDPPVSAEETIEIFAIMEAADLSKTRGGAPVAIEGVIERARGEAAKLRSW